MQVYTVNNPSRVSWYEILVTGGKKKVQENTSIIKTPRKFEEFFML
jgi:hypothetical protein